MMMHGAGYRSAIPLFIWLLAWFVFPPFSTFPTPIYFEDAADAAGLSLAGGEKWDAFVAWDESRRSTVEGVSSGREEGNRRPTKQISFGDES